MSQHRRSKPGNEGASALNSGCRRKRSVVIDLLLASLFGSLATRYRRFTTFLSVVQIVAVLLFQKTESHEHATKIDEHRRALHPQAIPDRRRSRRGPSFLRPQFVTGAAGSSIFRSSAIPDAGISRHRP